MRRVPEEYGDVELGGDLGRLLPSSLMRLVHPKLRRVELRALVENQALQYGVHGSDTRAAGPIVVCLDKSGSMEGSADTWSTALALAVLDQAQEERRTFAVLAFDGEVRSETIVRPGEKLPLAALFSGCDGGTDIDRVIERALDLIKAGDGLGRADVILVTDGVSDLTKAGELRERASACGVSIFGIGIGVQASALEPWCSPAISTSELATLDSATANALFAE